MVSNTLSCMVRCTIGPQEFCAHTLDIMCKKILNLCMPVCFFWSLHGMAKCGMEVTRVSV